MTAVTLSGRGLLWPFGHVPIFTTSSTTLDATGEKVAFIGKIAIAGKAASKTIDTTGSSKFTFSLTSGPIFDNASSEFRVGFQGIDATAQPVRPDGVWSAYTSITTAANSTPALTDTSNFHEKAPTSGTKTLSDGDEVCIVFEMTAKGGTDSVAVVNQNPFTSMLYPAAVTNISGSWANTSITPVIMITFSDGTIGTIDGTWMFSNGSTATLISYSDSSNPDEYGMIFQTPFDCKVDAFHVFNRLTDGASDFTLSLFSGAETGSPTTLLSQVWTAEQFANAANESSGIIPFGSQISLTANTDYCVALKATGTSSVRVNRATIPTAGFREFMGPAGTTMRSVTRNGGTGAFGSSSSTTLYPFGVRISEISGFGGGGGVLTHPGMAGGMRG